MRLRRGGPRRDRRCRAALRRPRGGRDRARRRRAVHRAQAIARPGQGQALPPRGVCGNRARGARQAAGGGRDRAVPHRSGDEFGATPECAHGEKWTCGATASATPTAAGWPPCASQGAHGRGDSAVPGVLGSSPPGGLLSSWAQASIASSVMTLCTHTSPRPRHDEERRGFVHVLPKGIRERGKNDRRGHERPNRLVFLDKFRALDGLHVLVTVFVILEIGVREHQHDAVVALQELESDRERSRRR